MTLIKKWKENIVLSYQDMVPMFSQFCKNFKLDSKIIEDDNSTIISESNVHGYLKMEYSFSYNDIKYVIAANFFGRNNEIYVTTHTECYLSNREKRTIGLNSQQQITEKDIKDVFREQIQNAITVGPEEKEKYRQEVEQKQRKNQQHGRINQMIKKNNWTVDKNGCISVSVWNMDDDFFERLTQLKDALEGKDS